LVKAPEILAKKATDEGLQTNSAQMNSDQSAQSETQYTPTGNIFSRLKDKFSRKAAMAESNAKMIMLINHETDEKNTSKNTDKVNSENIIQINDLTPQATKENVSKKEPLKIAVRNSSSNSDINNLIATLQKDKSSVSQSAKAGEQAEVVNPSITSQTSQPTVPVNTLTTTTKSLETTTQTHINKKKLGKVVIISPKKATSEKMENKENGEQSQPVIAEPNKALEQNKTIIKQPQINPTQTGNYYILQIMRGNKPKYISDYIKKHNLENKATILRIKRNNSDWYLLGYGHYATGAEAKNDISNLKANLKGATPWIRLIKENEATPLE